MKRITITIAKDPWQVQTNQAGLSLTSQTGLVFDLCTGQGPHHK